MLRAAEGRSEHMSLRLLLQVDGSPGRGSGDKVDGLFSFTPS
jgi:hypothetical protein